MQVTCPRCRATIEITVSLIGIDRYRWGTNEMETVEATCEEWKNTANAAERGKHCSALEAAVRSEVMPSVRGD